MHAFAARCARALGLRKRVCLRGGRKLCLLGAGELKILSDESWQLLAQRGWFSERPYQRDVNWFDSHLSYNFEHDTIATSIYPIARFVGSLATQHGSVVGALSSLRIWQSSHDDYLIRTMLSTLIGFGSGLPADGTMILIGSDEDDALSTMVHLAMLFGWDFELFCESQNLQIQIDHDGVIDIFAGALPASLQDAFIAATGRHPTVYRPTKEA